MLLDRIVCTGVGASLGIAVNLLVLAPLDDGLARAQVDRLCRELGELISDMAAALSTTVRVDPVRWISRSRRAEEQVNDAWDLLRHTREARVGNPRRRSRQLDPAEYETLLLRVDEGFTQARAMARTVQQSTIPPARWDEQFRREWLGLLADLGERLCTGTRPAEPATSARCIGDKHVL